MYIATYASNRGVVGGVPSHLERGGVVVCIGKNAVVAGTMAEVGVREFTPSLRRSIGGTVA